MPIRKSAIIILGASGDLAKRKLIPALETLFREGSIDGTNVIVGSGRTGFSDESFRGNFDITPEFARHLYYHAGDRGLKTRIDSLGGFERTIVFMALPPHAYADTASRLYDEGFGAGTTLIIEKPFGYDFESARRLNASLKKFYREDQILRIDHYLAKEAVQNILVFRFANPIFYPVWNSRYIESIQINAFESIGIENRGAYFDKAGIIRDVVQNHLLQLLSLVTMEAPISLDAEEIRSQKINILKAVELNACRKFQYKGYTDERGVAPGSTTETFVEITGTINTFRWTGIRICIRAGKALDRKGTEIGIRFRGLPRLLFNRDGDIAPNLIIFNIQPSEGIIVDLSSKVPGGDDIRVTNTNMKFCYKESFGDVEIPEAYRKLILDALKGDRTLFVGSEETEIAWRKVGPLLKEEIPHPYDRGTVPYSDLGIDWIAFERYTSACS